MRKLFIAVIIACSFAMQAAALDAVDVCNLSSSDPADVQLCLKSHAASDVAYSAACHRTNGPGTRRCFYRGGCRHWRKF